MNDAVSLLLVEDNPGDARLVDHHLDSPVTEAFVGTPDVEHVSALSAALDALAAGEYDLVLLDLGLPESRGLDTLDRLLGEFPDATVVVLTGNTDHETAIETIRRGAQDYLTKDALDEHTLARSLRYAIVRARHERELRRQNERLEEFARVVSHDLRNPLTVAQGWLEQAATADDAAVERVREAHDRMGEIIDDVLALARQGAVVDETEPVELGAAVESAARQTALADRVAVEGDLPTVEADRARLQTLLENLFRNAVDHSPDGVRVRIGAFEGGFYVEDDGPGIPEDLRGRVFESGFTTADGGTGFGLAIVERIATAHEWGVSVTEGETGGTRVEVALGVETAADPGV